MEEFAYDAFISYSHRDLNWARWIQERLETFPIPAEAGEPFANRRRMRVFRDQTDLAGVEVTASLRRELRASRYLVVVCSPNSAASRWVNDEVVYFESLGRGDQIVAFIVSGEPDSDTAELECYPPAMRATDDRHLLGANVQEIGRNKAFLKVVSLLIGVRFNRLVDREKQRRRRRIVSVAAVLLAVSAAIAALLWRNAAISRRNRALSKDAYGAAIVAFAQNESITPEDFERIRDSAEAGNTYAATLLGDCYAKGWGVEKDDALAFEWYKRAAEAGDPVGMIALANCYFSGMGTEENREAAFKWYHKSASKGYDLGMFNLSRCYRYGIGTQVDLERSFFWMRRLAETGNVPAMFNLGIMYQNGLGTPEDPEQAYAWYRRAADTGDGDALYMTGWCMENGYGVGNPALEWYEKAAEAGSEEAAAALERLGAGETDAP